MRKPPNGKDPVGRRPGMEILEEAPARETSPPITQEQIRQRAYALFLQRGGQHGNDLEDWFQAEAELRAEAVLTEALRAH